jgi:hypothetical protein
MRMRALALLLLLFGPVLSAPAAAGLWTWAWVGDQQYGLAYAAGAAGTAALVVAAAIHRQGLLREFAILALSGFWAGWLWLEMTARTCDWLQPPELRAPDGMDRVAITLIVLIYLTLHIVAEQARPRRVS